MIARPHLVAKVQQMANRYIASFRTRVLYLERILPGDPDATPTPAWDARRQQTTSMQDGSFGVGWQVTQKGVVRKGYRAPIPVTVGIEPAAQLEEITEAGVSVYEGPLLHYAPSITLPFRGAFPFNPRRGDVIILILQRGVYGTRYVIDDTVSPQTLFGTTIVAAAKLEERVATDIIYTIPTR